MQVSEILTSKGDRVIAIPPDVKIRAVAETLRREGIGAALVRAEDGGLLGIVSERDIVRGLAEEGSESLNRCAADVMSHPVATCQLESSTEELMERMLINRIRHLPVCRDDELVGIVSIGDVVKGVLSELKWREQVLQEQLVTAAGWSTDDADED